MCLTDRFPKQRFGFPWTGGAAEQPIASVAAMKFFLSRKWLVIIGEAVSFGFAAHRVWSICSRRNERGCSSGLLLRPEAFPISSGASATYSRVGAGEKPRA